MKGSMNVIVAEFHRLRKLSVHYIPMVIPA